MYKVCTIVTTVINIPTPFIISSKGRRNQARTDPSMRISSQTYSSPLLRFTKRALVQANCVLCVVPAFVDTRGSTRRVRISGIRINRIQGRHGNGHGNLKVALHRYRRRLCCSPLLSVDSRGRSRWWLWTSNPPVIGCRKARARSRGRSWAGVGSGAALIGYHLRRNGHDVIPDPILLRRPCTEIPEFRSFTEVRRAAPAPWNGPGIHHGIGQPNAPPVAKAPPSENADGRYSEEPSCEKCKDQWRRGCRVENIVIIV